MSAGDLSKSKPNMSSSCEEDAESEDESMSDTDEDSGGTDDDEDEPLLKYKRFAKDVVNCLNSNQGEAKNVIECMAVHSKFIALGTFDGSVKLVDHSGNILIDRDYASLHSAKINQISVDEDGECMSCCSDDGRVSIIGLFTSKYNNSVQFDRPIKSVAIHPHFGKAAANKIFFAGSDKLQMVEDRRWPLIGHKMAEIHQGYGLISTIKWRDTYIAWANDKAVYVYDVVLKEIIAMIKFDEESPSYLPFSLCWVKNDVLLVGKGHLVKIAEVRSDTTEIVEYAGGVDRKKKLMAITAQNTFTDYVICGVVPLVYDNNKWDLVVLGYDANVDQEDACTKGEVPPPQLIVIPPATYNSTNEEFADVKETSRDKLLPRGYSYCQAQEYHLECVLTGGEDRFYVLTPIDVILAQRTTPSDHIEWLISRKKFKEAMVFVENPSNAKLLPPIKVKDTGVKYIYHLMDSGDFKEAARKCPSVLNANDATRWEDIIYNFITQDQLKTILPFIPKADPKLSKATYELVLNKFLKTDTKVLLSTIIDWPSDIYDFKVVMNAIEIQLKSSNDVNLMKVKAKLHEDHGETEKALEIYLRLGDTEVFDLIRKKRLHGSLLENLQYLMKLGEKELQKTVDLLVEFRSEECIPPSRVVKKIESFKTGRDEKYFLYRYLDTLFEMDPKAGSNYHEQQVTLYADYDNKKLLPFLRACNDIPLQKALDVCKSRELHEAMVFLLDRMGNPQAALQIIVSDLKDVDKAILFVREKDDEDLWDNLIKLSQELPDFITGLLQNAGTHIDPTKLIKEIPEELEIDNLGSSLAKLLNDYQLQVSLRDGCKKILVKDSHSLMDKLHMLNRKGILFNVSSATCPNCSSDVSLDHFETLNVFFCGHMYHDSCTTKRNEIPICHLCYRSSRAHTLKQNKN